MDIIGAHISTSFPSSIVGCFPFYRILLAAFAVVTNSTAQVNPDSINAKALTAEQAATELVNPNSPLGRVTLQFKRWSFEGNPTDGSHITGYSAAFESSLPFPFSNGGIIRFRPNIPVYFQYPLLEPLSQKTVNRSGLADITFDLAYGKRNKAGILFAFGIAATLPTATVEELGNDCFSVGPEVLISINPEWGVVGIFPNHEWKIAGDGLYNRTVIQPLTAWLPGNGWSIASDPNIAYDWISKEWSIPWVVDIGKTSKFGSSIWTFSVEINYFGKKHESTTPEWMLGINVTRVVKNWFSTLL
ncbi:MAG TPA: hypothetical protein VFZ52_23575 [Chryseolinea sp.]